MSEGVDKPPLRVLKCSSEDPVHSGIRHAAAALSALGASLRGASRGDDAEDTPHAVADARAVVGESQPVNSASAQDAEIGTRRRGDRDLVADAAEDTVAVAQVEGGAIEGVEVVVAEVGDGVQALEHEGRGVGERVVEDGAVGGFGHDVGVGGCPRGGGAGVLQVEGQGLRPEDGGGEGVEGGHAEARLGRARVERGDVVEDGEGAVRGGLLRVGGWARVVLDAVAGGYVLEVDASGGER